MIILSTTITCALYDIISRCSYRKVKPLAQKMGLETGWNCAISLMPRKVRTTHNGAIGGTISVAARGQNSSVGKGGGLGQFGLDDDEEDFGVDGVMSDEKRSRLQRNAVDEQVFIINEVCACINCCKTLCFFRSIVDLGPESAAASWNS